MFRKKFDSKARKTILAGYHDDNGNYRLYDSTGRKIIISKDVKFKYSPNDENGVVIKVSPSRNEQVDESQKVEEIPDPNLIISGYNADENNLTEVMDISENEDEVNLHGKNFIQPVEAEPISTKLLLAKPRNGKRQNLYCILQL